MARKLDNIIKSIVEDDVYIDMYLFSISNKKYLKFEYDCNYKKKLILDYIVEYMLVHKLMCELIECNDNIIKIKKLNKKQKKIYFLLHKKLSKYNAVLIYSDYYDLDSTRYKKKYGTYNVILYDRTLYNVSQKILISNLQIIEDAQNNYSRNIESISSAVYTIRYKNTYLYKIKKIVTKYI